MQKARVVFKEYGVLKFATWAFLACYKRTVRKMMPVSGHVNYNDVQLPEKKVLFDNSLPKLFPHYMWGDIEAYEAALVKALKNHVRDGDRVVVVGGGVGVTVVHAARKVGTHGRVECFEGDSAGVDAVKRTVAHNDLDGRVRINHAVVGENIGVYGDASGATQLPPSELPECDVLELDCEGSEIGILQGMTIRPRCIAVETHGFLGAPSSDVEALLVKLGYRVKDYGVAEPHLGDVCLENDIKVVVGTR